MDTGILICPVCAASLAPEATTVRCPNGHSFDRARAGYVNLLCTKRHGDSREMLQARRAFLDRGHYAPLAAAVGTLLARRLTTPHAPPGMPPSSSTPAAHTGSAGVPPVPVRGRRLPDLAGSNGPTGSAGVSPVPVSSPRPTPTASARVPPASFAGAARPGPPHPIPAVRTPPTLPSSPRAELLDAGCGEGYYLDHLQRHLTATQPERSFGFWGLDSSRDAIQLAARRNRTLSLVVADIKEQLPFATHALQAVLCIFAPRHPAEFARVLAPGGLLLLVIPGPEHLQELRDPLDLLAMEENKRAHVIDAHAPWFTLVEEEQLTYSLGLETEDVRLLVTMSPNHRHISDRREGALQALGLLRVTAAFTLLAFTVNHTYRVPARS